MSHYLDIQLTFSGEKVDKKVEKEKVEWKIPNLISIPGVLTLALLCIYF